MPFHPVTGTSFDTASCHRFATGCFLRRDAARWFWDPYTTDEAECARATATLRAWPTWPTRNSAASRRTGPSADGPQAGH